MGSRFRMGIVVVAVAAAACASSRDDAAAARHRCEQLRDHLIDVRLAEVGPQSPIPTIAMPETLPGRGPAKPVVIPPINLEHHRAAMKQALGAQFLDTCQRTMPKARVACVLDAKTSAEIAACNEPVHPAHESPPAVTTASK